MIYFFLKNILSYYGQKIAVGTVAGSINFSPDKSLVDRPVNSARLLAEKS